MQEKIKGRLSLLLLAGIFLSAALVLCGAFLYLWKHGQLPMTFPRFGKTPLSYTAIFPVLQGLRLGDPAAFIFSGFLVLVFSQVLRVLVLGIYFLQGQEYWLALASGFIFIVLLYSLCGQ